MTRRVYHDPLHLGICLDSSKPGEAMVMDLIDSYPFQRLRRIRQLGPAFLTFHGAESSRFTHSLGVFHLARRAFESLLKLDSDLEEFRGLLYGAALLHDLGHGPLSHTSEEVFGIQHEQWSGRLVLNHEEISQPLENFAKGTSNAVADLLTEGIATSRVIKALVSSQLDCDRMDYLLRDSHSTGTRYGQLDVERILAALTIAPDRELAIHPKGLMAVEHYLVIRNLMYRSVYNHRLNEVCSWLLEQLIKSARELSPQEIWADAYMAKWLWNTNDIDIETFLANDDVRTGYHLLRWQEEAPPQLSELCKRFLNRRLLKALGLEKLSNEDQLTALSVARQLAERQGLNPDIFCGLRHKNLRSYEPYKGGLRIWDGENLNSLEQVSELVKGLISPVGSSWLIYPKEIHKKLKEELNLLDLGSKIF